VCEPSIKVFRVKSIQHALLAVVFLCTRVSFAQVGALPKKNFTLKTTTDSKFSVGDVWEYRTRPGEEGSRFIITRIDDSPELGLIVSIAVNGVRFKNCHGGNAPNDIQHMPFARKALDASVVRRVATAQQFPDELVGAHDEWKSAYLDKKAGIYIVSVPDAIGVAEATFRRGIDCPTQE